jgi:hypothetical protein
MLRIERNGVLVEIPLEVEHEGAAAIEAHVTAAAGPSVPAESPAHDGGAD